MKKTPLRMLMFLLLIFLAACQEEEPVAVEKESQPEGRGAPEERLQAYIGHWSDAAFSDMYSGYLNEGTKTVYGEKTFVSWQQQLYEKLEIKNLTVDYEAPAEEIVWNPEEPADFRIHIKMDTIAGPLEFDKTLTLLYENHEGTEDWFVEWDPSFILPQLEEGDVVQTGTTPALRGEIRDRHNKPVAVNSPGYEIGIIPENFTNERRKPELAQLLGLTEEEVEAKLNASWVRPNHYVPMGRVAATEKEKLEQLATIAGVERREVTFRHYPYGAALSHLTGFIGPITAEQLAVMKDKGYAEDSLIGRRGLEEFLEDRLRGEQGGRIYIEKAGNSEETITVAEKEPKQGETIKLTIDAELQKIAYNAMSGEAGTAAAVNPETGETIVLLSAPGFDPNEFISGMPASRFKELQENPKQPFFNRFAASYTPGSTIKPVTAAIGLESGTLDPAEGLEINGKTWQRYASWGDYRVTRLHEEAPNPIDLNKALIYSDNIYFARQAMEIGRDGLVEGLKAFGFGEAIPFPLELTSSQISNNGLLNSEGQLADTSFGQGQMQTNILHLAAMYAPFLTDGTMPKPVLFAEEAKGQVWKEGLITQEHAQLLRSSLRNVVTQGFARSANLASTPVAGKTGTAQTPSGNNGLFVSYNAKKPTLILALLVENAETSDPAAGMAAKVLEAAK